MIHSGESVGGCTFQFLPQELLNLLTVEIYDNVLVRIPAETVVISTIVLQT